MLRNIFGGFCYWIYRNALLYHRQSRKIFNSNKAIIDPTARLADIGMIYNNRDQSSIRIGYKTLFKGELMTFKHGGEIIIGDYCFIGDNTKIWSAKKITIGNRVLIAHNVNIHDQVAHPLNSAERHADYKYIFEKGNFQESVDLHEKEIVIQDDVWIGFNATILKGVTIGKGAIIGAGTLITQDVPEYAVIAGNPPRVIKQAE
jgi:acetyltransferase-like isoleucine patch superfamily enzyme